MINRLRHKLTVLYAGLFCLALVLIGATAYVVVAKATEDLARAQLSKSAEAFRRYGDQHLARLASGARHAAGANALQSAAIARDTPGIRAALSGARADTDADLAFFVTREGLIVAEDGSAQSSVSPGLQQALSEGVNPSGVMSHGDTLYRAATAELPGELGWVVVAARIDGESMRSLERLAIVPLLAVLSTRSAEGWSNVDTPDSAAIDPLLDAATREDVPARKINAASGRTLALARSLHSLDGTRASLLLRYRISGMITPYGAMFSTMIAIGIAGLALLLAGSWFLARSITRPLSTLEAAAKQMQAGVFENITVSSKDEIGHVAESFNAMAGAIRERERKISQLAYHDGETRMPNRVALERRLAGAANAERLYLAAIGVDRFAHVRGAIGYSLAGILVRTLGERLARLVPNAPVARPSSDVLCVAFLSDDDADARRRAEALIIALEQPVSLEGHELDVHVSIGVAQPRVRGETPTAMIERASIALDQARAARQKLALFDKAAYGDPARNLSLMSEMMRALDSGEMSLAHQPKYDFRSGRIHSAETLVRWRHPTRGMISPDVFVPMAEETGHIRALTEWALRRTIADQRHLADSGWPLTFSVNISARLLSDEDFARAALDLVRQAARQLCFEITETAVIDNPKKALENIERFAANGVRIAIDDYGSGLSSLSYLKQLPAHELKIDKMFIESITNSQRDALLVRSTIDLARGLGMEVVAEGVETPAAFALLASMKCDLAQGYLVSRPTSIDDLAALLADERRMRYYQQTAAATAPQPLPRTA